MPLTALGALHPPIATTGTARPPAGLGHAPDTAGTFRSSVKEPRAPRLSRSTDCHLELSRRRFIRFSLRDVVDELSWFHAEPRGNVQECQHAGAALTVLDVDEAAEAQAAAFREFFQAVAPLLSESTDLHTKGQESRVGRRFTCGHIATRPARLHACHEQLCIIAPHMGNLNLSTPRAARRARREIHPPPSPASR